MTAAPGPRARPVRSARALGPRVVEVLEAGSRAREPDRGATWSVSARPEHLAGGVGIEGPPKVESLGEPAAQGDEVLCVRL